eukprot:gene20698-22734_t
MANAARLFVTLSIFWVFAFVTRPNIAGNDLSFDMICSYNFRLKVMSKKRWVKSIFSKISRRCIRVSSGSSPIMGRSAIIEINSGFLLLLSGDIETNPGPDMETNPGPSSSKSTGKTPNEILQDERHEAVMEFLKSLQTGQKDMMERQDLTMFV